jgi:hypothetical protein
MGTLQLITALTGGVTAYAIQKTKIKV